MASQPPRLPRPSDPVIAAFRAGRRTTDDSTTTHRMESPMSLHPLDFTPVPHPPTPQEDHHLHCFIVNFSFGGETIKISMPEGGRLIFGDMFVGQVFIEDGLEFIRMSKGFFVRRGSAEIKPVSTLLCGDEIVFEPTGAVISVAFDIERHSGGSSEM